MRYVASVLGDEEVETSSRTHDMNGGRASRQLATSRNPLAAPHVLRQMIPGDALLVHGTLPPAHVRTRPYYRERTLRRRAAVPVPARPTERPSAVMAVTTDAAANCPPTATGPARGNDEPALPTRVGARPIRTLEGTAAERGKM